MKFKRLLMPLLVLGIFLTMGSMAFAQSTVTCSLVNTAGDVTNGAPALLGATGHATATGHTEPIMAGATGVPPGVGGGALRVVCTNTGAAGAASNSPGVV